MPFAACCHGFKQKIIKVFSQMFLLFEEKKVVSADVVHKTKPQTYNNKPPKNSLVLKTLLTFCFLNSATCLESFSKSKTMIS